MPYLIGLDIGTTSTKAIAFSVTGRIWSEAYAEYPIHTPQPSFSEQDPEEIFRAVLQVTRNVVARHPDEELLGVSCSSAMHSVIAMDISGKALTACIIWADTRSKAEAERIKGSREGHEIYMSTGTPIHPMSPLCKLAWLRTHQPGLFYSTYKFISIKEYVLFRLFGRYYVDYSLASATGLFDIFRLQWHEGALAMAGVSARQLSEPVPPTFVLTGMHQECAAFMGIRSDLPFVIGASDGCLANLGSNAIRPGNAAVTIGTSGAIRVLADKPATDRQERIFSYILTEHHYVLGGSISNAGVVLRWFRDTFAAPEIAEAQKEGTNAYLILNQKAASIPAGSGGLIFLPYLLGERAPVWDASARGVFFGVNINHTREHFLRAVLEGVMYAVYSVGKALQETTGEINVIYANGGFVRSELWVQMLADVFNKRVLVTESFESSAVGAALMGMKALGLIASFEEVEGLIPIIGTYQPDPRQHEIYMRNFNIFERLYDKLKDEFPLLNC
jgi:gluconokinase